MFYNFLKVLYIQLTKFKSIKLFSPIVRHTTTYLSTFSGCKAAIVSEHIPPKLDPTDAYNC